MIKLYEDTITLIDKIYINNKDEKIIIPKGTNVRVIDILDDEWCTVEFIDDINEKFPHTSDYKIKDLK